MHGGMKIYRGAAAAARHYVEADRSRADDYYLAEGSGVAMHFGAGLDKLDQRVLVERRADMDGETYEQWVARYNVGLDKLDQRLMPKGRLRKDEKGVRFVEVTVNGPKTWSLAPNLPTSRARPLHDTCRPFASTDSSTGTAKGPRTPARRGHCVDLLQHECFSRLFQ